MWRSEPQTPVASTRTIASSRSTSSGSGRSSTATSPGAWNVTACIGVARYSLADCDRSVRALQRGLEHLDTPAGPGHAGVERERLGPGEVMEAGGGGLAAGAVAADWEREEPRPGREGAEALEFFPTGETIGWHTAME